LAITIGGSLTLYAFKAPNVKSEALFSGISRETLLLVNNFILIVMAATVLLGTLYPLLLDAIGGGKISVGPPYFNALFVPIMGAMCVVLGISIAMRWRETSFTLLKKTLWKPAAVSLFFGLVFALIYGKQFHVAVLIGMTLSFWVIFTALQDFAAKFNHAKNIIEKLKTLPLSYYGMVIAHLGVAVVAIGITLVSYYSEERDSRMATGDSLELAGYTFEFKGTTAVTGENYTAQRAQLAVTKNGAAVTTLTPEKRSYNTQRSMMTEASIDWGLWRDLYVAMGEPLENGAWAIRIQYKPFVRWIWLGGGLISLGGLVTVADKRYRKKAASV
jgi:cytochrome c-type biogenesis protein CcmF